MTYALVGASADVDVYANWAEIMVRMTYGSVGKDYWTVVQNKIHPAVVEPAFTPLDLSYMAGNNFMIPTLTGIRIVVRWVHRTRSHPSQITEAGPRTRPYLVDHQFPEFPQEGDGDYNDEPPKV